MDFQESHTNLKALPASFPVPKPRDSYAIPESRPRPLPRRIFTFPPSFTETTNLPNFSAPVASPRKTLNKNGPSPSTSMDINEFPIEDIHEDHQLERSEKSTSDDATDYRSLRKQKSFGISANSLSLRKRKPGFNPLKANTQKIKKINLAKESLMEYESNSFLSKCNIL